MCLAIPVRVIEVLPDAMARVSLDGVAMTVSVALLDDVAPGDHVVLHVGYAIAKIDEGEAVRTLALMRDAAAGQAQGGEIAA
jgi:hydrogenase expression/formation protein HypC